MTKENIEIAIRRYLNNHLNLISQLERDEISDVVITQICMAVPFAYVGRNEYEFTGNGEGWIHTDDGGKSIRHFKIQPSLAFIYEGDEGPIIDIKEPIIISYL